MIEDFFDGFEEKNEVKDVKGSIRRKYRTRLKNLAWALNEFISHAENRLNSAKAGNIHKRDETEKLLEHCKALRATIPIKNPMSEELSEDANRNLNKVLGIDPD
ncbi:hypothetical protein ACO0LM_22215 [Undibacterium sp. Di26W]|uniref:hypothetical protein n=1 Tax=Undibacterium sp. Di26W TaxID=3413035 RepID=UPI003BF15A50